MFEQADDLGAAQDRRKTLLVAGADLREDAPLIAAEHLQVEKPGAGGTLADRLGPPPLAEFDVQEVVAHLPFVELPGIAAKVLVQQPHVPVVGVPRAGPLVAQAQKARETLHRSVGMRPIKHRIDGLEGRSGAFAAATAAARRFVLAGRIVSVGF